MRYLSVLLIFPLWICGLVQRDLVDGYLQYCTKHQEFLGESGDYKRCEIEVVKDKKRISEIQEMQNMRFIKEGMSKEEALSSSRVGVIHEDNYWIWIRDAVVFPTGAEGTYNRILFKEELNSRWSGISILPMYPDGRVALILTYRHALRSWSLEVPRGGREGDESIEETLSRELKSETGIIASKWKKLGEMTPDSGVLSARMPVYAAIIDKKDHMQQDDTEAILGVRVFTVKELDDAIKKGYIQLDIKGKKTKVEVKDSFLTYALYLSKLKESELF